MTVKELIAQLAALPVEAWDRPVTVQVDAYTDRMREVDVDEVQHVRIGSSVYPTIVAS